MNTTIKLAAVAILLAGTAAMAGKTVTRNSHNHSHNTTTNNYTTVGTPGAQGVAGTNGTNGVNGAAGAQGVAGVNGTNGINGTNGSTTIVNGVDLRKLRVASTAMDSVELNPDHKGFSVSIGGAGYAGEWGSAIGVMYGQKLSDTSFVKTIGYNIKAYTAEGGYHGAGAGITVGF